MKQNVKKWLTISGTVVGAVVVGAAAMYFLDPERGSNRRAFVRHKAWRAGKSLGHTFGDSLPQYWRDTKNAAVPWAQNVAAQAGDIVNDAALTQRLRSEVARFADAANDVHVRVDNGFAYLRGAAPRKVAHKLAKRARSIGGVLGVENQIALRA